MQVTCKKQNLLGSLDVVERIIPSKALLPITEGVLIEAENDKLTFTTTNTEVTIQAEGIKADIWEEGAIVLPPRFISLVKHFQQEILQIEMGQQVDEKKHRINVVSGEAKYHFNGIDPADFPRPQHDEKQKWHQIAIPTKQLKDILRKTLFAVAHGEGTPAVFKGLLVEADGQKIHFVGSDTYRLANAYTPLEEAPVVRSVIPAKSLEELNRIIGDDDGNVTFYFSSNQCRFIYKQFTITTLVYAGDYPDFTRIFPDEYNTKLKVKRDPLEQALARALLMTFKDNTVVISLKDNKLLLKAASEMGGGSEVVPLEERNGDDLEIRLNGRLLMDPLRALTEKEIHMNFTGSLGPCVINHPQYTYLLLPIKK
ncbi:MAG: hypothetical protein AVO34_06880 [Firmicutes bacterium ML8_F2]|jgi:DNA polymerase III subunit beta|nr:MAG: hypothetical protein AVO34_06880 [Firmicutes bacterium ML8_F2]